MLYVINTVTFMQFKVANSYLDLFPGTPTLPVLPDPNNDGVYVTLEQWYGFQAERNEIIGKVGGAMELPEVTEVKNFITITGDIHSFIAGYIKRNFNDSNPITSPPQNVPDALPPQDAVGVEFVCGSTTSANLAELATFGRGRSGHQTIVRMSRMPSLSQTTVTPVLQLGNPRLQHHRGDTGEAHLHHEICEYHKGANCYAKHVQGVRGSRRGV
ncbi:MAG TPA: alkaline phosphatase D family protein [Rubrobacteraceae bacterium]|nr:alkaline phosphatase D family protein [Rubrobacteraceae bacterium]